MQPQLPALLSGRARCSRAIRELNISVCGEAGSAIHIKAKVDLRILSFRGVPRSEPRGRGHTLVRLCPKNRSRGLRHRLKESRAGRRPGEQPTAPSRAPRVRDACRHLAGLSLQCSFVSQDIKEEREGKRRGSEKKRV